MPLAMSWHAIRFHDEGWCALPDWRSGTLHIHYLLANAANATPLGYLCIRVQDLGAAIICLDLQEANEGWSNRETLLACSTRVAGLGERRFVATSI